MAHGNKKFFFDELKQKGDFIIVNTINISSLRSQVRLYTERFDHELKVDIDNIGANKYRLTRTSDKIAQIV